ncbi:Fic family protein [Methylocystis parvus]|uniref:Fic family protein n=1 Tax=Methylocystis parvus TaxID=134 RepID=UPI003C73A206
MDPLKFTRPSGTLVPTIQGQKAFIPSQLPPQLNLTAIQQTLSEADQKLGELRGIGRYLPNPFLLIRPLQRKEAIASSNIEGTYTSLPELLMFESGADDSHRTTVDTREVYNYVTALQTGMELLGEVPVSNRMIYELHRTLLRGLPRSRTGYYEAGQYRTEQNFIGKSKDVSKSRFNPPPPPVHLECMRDLEAFINDEAMAGLPPLVFAALVHYQFETIHPFPDGNGRVGRLLIPLILRSRQVMDQPLLYMSQYFEDNKDEYTDLMLNVSCNSEWIQWISFFLRGVTQSCEKTIVTIHRVMEMQENYKAKCQQARSSALLIKIIDKLFETLLITTPMIQELTGTSYTAAKNNIGKLIECGVIEELKYDGRTKFYFSKELTKLFES